MSSHQDLKSRLSSWLLVAIASLLTLSSPAVAQGMEGMSCPMCSGTWGVVGGVLGVTLIIAVVAALVALAVFLWRRSGGPRQRST